MERARAWAEAKAKVKAEIARIAADGREKAEDKVEARVRKKADAVQTAAV